VLQADSTQCAQWQAIDQQLLKAHADNDLLSLADLYQQAAMLAKSDRDTTAMRFYLTQAMVYALDSGCDNIEDIRELLSGNI